MGMFDVKLEIVNDWRLRTKRYEKRDDFNPLKHSEICQSSEGTRAVTNTIMRSHKAFLR
jgi:hypothetical protein